MAFPGLTYAFDPMHDTPAMIAERRKRAADIAARIGMGQPSIGAGIGDIFRGLGAGLANYRADQAETAGNRYGQSSIDLLNGILAQPANQGLPQPPDNGTVTGAIKSAITTGQPPQLPVYTPPRTAQDIPTVQAPRMAPQPAPVADTQDSQDAPDTPQQPVAMAPAPNNANLIPKIMQVLNNPWVSDADKAVLRNRLEEIQKQSDPGYQLDLKVKKAQLENLTAPDLKTYSDPNSGDLYTYDSADPAGTMKLVRKADTAAAAAGKEPAAVQEYKYAKENGYQGTFADWQVMNKTGVNIYNNGAAADPLPQVQVDQNGVPDKGSQEAFIAQLNPSDRTLVRGMINYQIDPTKFASLKGGERQRLVELAQAADPTFDISQFKSRSSFKQSLASGNYGNALNSANLVIQHMDALAKAAADLNNGSYPMKNWIGNTVSENVGNPAVTNFRTAKKAVAAELAKVFKGVGATDVNSINEWEQNFSENSSPEQIKGAIDTAAALLSSRIDTIRNQYSSVMGKPMDFKVLTPHSQEVLQRLNLDLGDANVPQSGDYGAYGNSGSAAPSFTKPDPTLGGKVGDTPAPAGVDPKVWQFMTPEERKLWQ